jgi:hypothetical protein
VDLEHAQVVFLFPQGQLIELIGDPGARVDDRVEVKTIRMLLDAGQGILVRLAHVAVIDRSQAQAGHHHCDLHVPGLAEHVVVAVHHVDQPLDREVRPPTPHGLTLRDDMRV